MIKEYLKIYWQCKDYWFELNYCHVYGTNARAKIARERLHEIYKEHPAIFWLSAILL